MDITIRCVEVHDAHALAVLLRGLGIFAKLEAESLEATTSRIARLIALCCSDNSHTQLAAIDEGRLVGYVSVHWNPYLFLFGPEGFISELFIEEPYRGKGIGAQLLAVVKDEAVQRGCARLLLENSRERESYQREFYKKQGWEERKDMASFVLKLK